MSQILPSGIARFAHDLRFLPGDPTPQSLSEFALASAFNALDVSVCILLTAYQRVGSQMLVSEEVSRDLLASDIGAPRFAEVPWPSDLLEFVFQDRRLPSVLVSRLSGEQLARIGFPYMSSAKDVIQIVAQGAGGAVPMSYVVRYPTAAMDRFAENHNHHHHCMAGNGIEGLDMEEAEALQFMALLAFKVLVFCSVPAVSPPPLTLRTKKMGGKPGFQSRPKRPAFHVAYLPGIRDSLVRSTGTQPGAARAFLGRRGHLHWYRHERFTQRRGSFDFFPPIYGPYGTTPVRKFRVRRPA